MHCTRKVTEDIYWVGADDRRLHLFENIFPIPNGVSYNSYLIMDEKVTLMDTADFSVTRQFMENIDYVLQGKEIDYLVINHMEPDHCANIENLAKRFPKMQLVGNKKTAQMMSQFFDMDFSDRMLLVNELDELCIGKHTLQFVFAPMVHWPEAMVTYEKTEKILFSADAFGTFGTLNGNIFMDEIDYDSRWLADARRYYTNIVGKYGVQVQNLLKKASGLDIAMICALHGPIIRKDPGFLIDKYIKWSTYEPEDKSVMIVYGSMYGNTESAVNALASRLGDAGVSKIAVYDVSTTHVSELIAEIFRCSHLVLACPTYNGGIYPPMENFITDMKALNVQNRKVALLDNGTWAPAAGKQMVEMLGSMKNMEILGDTLSVKSALKADKEEQMAAFVQLITDSYL